jgi:hypothetical protein
MPPRKQKAGMGGLSEPRERAALGLQRSDPEAETPVKDSAAATGSNPNQWEAVLVQKREEEPWPASHCSKEVEARAGQGPVK